jgi:hypothetical protein
MAKLSRNGYLRVLILIVIFGGGFGLAGFCFFFWGWPLLDRTEFEHSAWLRGDIRERGRMVEDLVNQGILDGKSMEEVRDFLGPPDAVRDRTLDYTVDTGEKFIFKSWYRRLSIWPDAEGRVKGYQIENLGAGEEQHPPPEQSSR